MIKARNLNKYFNQNKSNEIHVINDTSLTLPETGLVCLLGPSGSGKTTLLNVLGGLDKVDSGEIIFKDYLIKSYRSNKWDYIRNRHFGYIFQNYVLLPELTVYRNLEFVLKMLNISQDEIEERINNALSAVGMEKYKKRKPTQLSGGQQQRIAIARALVKSPDVVIADEPTGNLDEKNTTQIMNIIKKISHECLVILVTHERRLAEFYGDIIYEVSDGKIIDERTITAERKLYHLDDRNLYLREFESEEILTEDINIKYFFGKEKPKLDLNIVFKEGTFYINSDNDDFKVKLIDKDSEIKVIDSLKPVIKSKNIEKFDYYMPPIKEKGKPRKSNLGFRHTLGLAFNQLKTMRRRQKLIYFVFFLSAIMICLGFLNLHFATNVEEKNFLYFNRNLIILEDDNIYKNDEEMQELKEAFETNFLLPHPQSIRVGDLRVDYFIQSKGYLGIEDLNSIIPFETVKNPKLVLGRLPEYSSELVIDKLLVNSMLKNPRFTMYGLMYQEQLLELEILINNRLYKIVGIIDNNNPNLYLLEKEFQSLVVNFSIYNHRLQSISYTMIEEYYNIDDYFVNNEKKLISDLDLKDNQVLVNNVLFSSNNRRSTISLGPHNEYTYEIVGVFNSSGFSKEVLMTNSEIEFHYYNEIANTRAIAVYTEDKAEAIKKVEELGYAAYDIYDVEFQRERETMYLPEVTAFSLIIIIASLVFLYFLMRSRLISRVYEVGVYRALGVKKADIYKIFLSEILLLSVFSGVFGIGLVSWLIIKINSFIEAFHYPLYIPLISFTFMLLVNVLVGLLPVRNLLKLTPSQILSKYDI